jgi:hypothetical protein
MAATCARLVHREDYVYFYYDDFELQFWLASVFLQHNVITNNDDLPRIVKMQSRKRCVVRWRSLSFFNKVFDQQHANAISKPVDESSLTFG